MGEAKRRRHQRCTCNEGGTLEVRAEGEHRMSCPQYPQYAPQVQKIREIRGFGLDVRVYEQLQRRWELVKKQHPSFVGFLGALLMAGLEVFDGEFEALAAHQRGESKSVAPQPEPERLVVSADEITPAHAKALVKMHEANMLGGAA